MLRCPPRLWHFLRSVDRPNRSLSWVVAGVRGNVFALEDHDVTRYFPPEAVRAFGGSLWSAFIAGGAVFCAAVGATTATDGINWIVIWATTGSAVFGVLAKGTQSGYRQASTGAASVSLSPGEQAIIAGVRSGEIIFDPTVTIGN